MRGLFNRFANFMQGRYGTDKLRINISTEVNNCVAVVIEKNLYNVLADIVNVRPACDKMVEG